MNKKIYPRSPKPGEEEWEERIQKEVFVFVVVVKFCGIEMEGKQKAKKSMNHA